VGAVIAVGLFDQVEPQTVAWFRVIGATLALVAVSRAWRERWTRSELFAAAMFGIATALMNLFFYLAIDRIDLGKAVTIEFIGPIAVAAVATRSARNAVALLFAVAGVVVLGGGEIEGNAVGLLFIGLASAMWAAYIVIGSRVARLDRGVAGLGVGLAIGALVIAPVGAPGSGDVWTSPRLLACACWSACSPTRSATASTSSRCAGSRSAGSRCCSPCSRSPRRSSAGSCSINAPRASTWSASGSC
jgi:inner membrane transporter RhtA